MQQTLEQTLLPRRRWVDVIVGRVHLDDAIRFVSDEVPEDVVDLIDLSLDHGEKIARIDRRGCE